MPSARPNAFLAGAVFPLFIGASVANLPTAAQTVPDMAADTTMTTFEIPNDAALVVGDGSALLVSRDQISRLDPATKKLIIVPTEKMWIFSVALGDGSIWVLGKIDGRPGIFRIDPATGKTVDTIPLAQTQIGMLSYHYGALWIWSFPLHYRPLLRVDPATKQIMAIDLGKGSGGEPGFSDGKVWIVGTESGIAHCLDARTGKILDQFPVGHKHNNGIRAVLTGGSKAGIYTSAVADGMLWVGNSEGVYADKHDLYGFDIKTHAQVAQLETGGSVGPPVLWNGGVWLAARGDQCCGPNITKFDAKTGGVVGRLAVPAAFQGRYSDSSPPMLMSDEDSLWVLGPIVFRKGAPGVVRRIQRSAPSRFSGQLGVPSGGF